MSENLSSRNFFHFTPKETLKKILENRFYALYSEEEIFKTAFDKDDEPNQYIPMVSFCNIPLTMIRKHSLDYYEYGIGLKNKWVKANRINPVLYSYRGSTLMNFYYNSQLQYDNLFDETEEKNEKFVRLFSDTFKKPLLFLKPVEGMNYKTGKETFFYDEKEWRYVPALEQMNDTTINKRKLEEGALYFIVNGERLYINNKTDLNNKILGNSLKNFESYKLHFELDDIEFIILKQNSEIIEMVEYIISTFKNDNTDTISDELKILITKIITLEQLTDDF